MRTLITFITLLVFLTGLTVAQSTDGVVKDINIKYRNIRDSLATFDTTMTEIWDESTEGGDATAYYDKGELKLLEVNWFGEIGKRIIAYYFDNGQLIFALDQDFNYNRPIYWDEKTAKENGDTEVFDADKTTVKEDRYYFNDRKLFLWIDNDKNEIDLTLGTNTLVGQGLISHAYKILHELDK